MKLPDKDNLNFKTAFKATCGFYFAQALITVIGISIIGLIILTCVYFLIK